jgi:hypothetical protein
MVDNSFELPTLFSMSAANNYKAIHTEHVYVEKKWNKREPTVEVRICFKNETIRGWRAIWYESCRFGF